MKIFVFFGTIRERKGRVENGLQGRLRKVYGEAETALGPFPTGRKK